jgi:fermentation-respiration switch protein FrsA (DUF1100 family)
MRLPLCLVTALLALGCATGSLATTRDPTPSLLHHYSPLAHVERRSAPAYGARVQRWWLISARGDTFHALWRPVPAGAKRPWTAVMLGGFDTGDRAALLFPEDSTFNALAVDWPWRGPNRLSPAEFAMRLPAIQRAVMRSPSVLALGAEAVAQTRGVDASRIVLVGASLGAPPALAALRLTTLPDAVVLVDAGADIELLVSDALQREGWHRGPAELSAAGAIQWLWPLEPALNAPAATGLPVLLMNSTGDERVPRASAAKLHASLPHATVRWRNGPHLRPSQPGVIARLVADVNTWLRGQPARPRAAAGALAPGPAAR